MHSCKSRVQRRRFRRQLAPRRRRPWRVGSQRPSGAQAFVAPFWSILQHFCGQQVLTTLRPRRSPQLSLSERLGCAECRSPQSLSPGCAPAASPRPGDRKATNTRALAAQPCCLRSDLPFALRSMPVQHVAPAASARRAAAATPTARPTRCVRVAAASREEVRCCSRGLSTTASKSPCGAGPLRDASERWRWRGASLGQRLSSVAAVRSPVLPTPSQVQNAIASNPLFNSQFMGVLQDSLARQGADALTASTKPAVPRWGRAAVGHRTALRCCLPQPAPCAATAPSQA